MKKQDFVKKLAEQLEISQAKADKVYMTFYDILGNHLIEMEAGESIRLPFGVFKKFIRKARQGVNPINQQPYSTPDQKAIKFSSSLKLRKFLNK